MSDDLSQPYAGRLVPSEMTDSTNPKRTKAVEPEDWSDKFPAKAALPPCPCPENSMGLVPDPEPQEEAAEPRADARLKTCPHCGALSWLERHDDIFQGATGYRVECLGICHSMTCYWHTETQAIEAWNMRPGDPCPVSPKRLITIAHILDPAQDLVVSIEEKNRACADLRELADWLERGRA